MNVPNDTLDRLAAEAFVTNSRLLHAGDALGQGRTTAARETLGKAREGNWRLLRALVSAGAADPLEKVREETSGVTLVSREFCTLSPPHRPPTTQFEIEDGTMNSAEKFCSVLSNDGRIPRHILKGFVHRPFSASMRGKITARINGGRSKAP
jgi:hypothetical protein